MKIAFYKKFVFVAIISLLLIPLLANTASGDDSISESILTAKVPLLNAQLGFSTAISGDRIVVGAPFANSAYVFERHGNTWDEGYELPAPPSPAPYFGWDVAISDNTVIVGAFHFLTLAGSAHVYRYDGTNWVYEAELISGPGVGASVTIDGNTAVVGAIIQISSGSAYVFWYDETNSNWIQEDELTAQTSFPPFFGWDVAISANTAVVGAPSFVDPPAGTTHVFNRNISDGTWTEIDIPLTTNSPVEGTYFGGSVAIDGNKVVVGAPSFLHPFMPSSDSPGSAHVFRLNPDNSWDEEPVPIPAANDFGNSVDISGNTVVVGAPLDDDLSKAEEGFNVGATYVFRYVGGAWVELERPLRASDGGATDQFGWSVAVDSDTVAVGALFWDYLVDDLETNDSGAAYALVLPSPNQRPIAKAEADPKEAIEGDLVVLDGSLSDDPEGDPLTYEWVQKQIDGEPLVELDLSNPVYPTFVAPELNPECMTLTFELTVTDDKGLTSEPAAVEVKVVPNNKIYSELRRKHRHWIYWHKYEFKGSAGEEVTITLDADPSGWHRGKRATLMLKDKIHGVRFYRKDRGWLPNTITATLPADGEYAVYVVKQPWFCRGKSFREDYILTVKGTCGKLRRKTFRRKKH